MNMSTTCQKLQASVYRIEINKINLKITKAIIPPLEVLFYFSRTPITEMGGKIIKIVPKLQYLDVYNLEKVSDEDRFFFLFSSLLIVVASLLLFVPVQTN